VRFGLTDDHGPMVSNPPLGITGATGRLGGRIARRLSAAGVPQRLLVRDTSRAPALQHSEVVQATYADGPAVTAALRGLDVVLMVSASEAPNRVDQHKTFIDAAADAGVEHLVYISFYGAAPDATFTLARDHFDTEQHIRSRGLAATFLRDNLYLDFLPGLAGGDGVLRGPAGDGRVAAVAQDDIADVAAAVLQAPGEHAGSTYQLTGPEALTLYDVAEQLTQAAGRPIEYQVQTVEEAYASRAGTAPSWQLDAWVSTYTAIASGELATVTADVQRLAGHAPRSLRQVLAES
jgi:NAD(P)H dehydrogenase (quinone)